MLQTLSTPRLFGQPERSEGPREGLKFRYRQGLLFGLFLYAKSQGQQSANTDSVPVSAGQDTRLPTERTLELLLKNEVSQCYGQMLRQVRHHSQQPNYDQTQETLTP